MRKFVSSISAVLTALIALTFVSCGAHSPRVLAERYRTIHISVVQNETTEFGLEERLTHSFIQAFRRDGQLRVVRKNDADLTLNARITDAFFVPHTFTDLDRAVGYRMRLTLMVDVIDNANGEALIAEKPFQAQGDFLLSTSPTTTTARDVNYVLAEAVLSHLVEGW